MIMGNLFNIPKVKMNQYGRTTVSSVDISTFKHLLGNKIVDIIMFDNGTDELLEQGRVILPRHYHIFEGMKDGEQQFKPYEHDQYRIVVSTYKDTIINVEYIG